MSKSNQEWDINEFTTQASKFIETHFKKALAVFVVAIIASGIYSYKKSLDKDKEMAAFNDLYKITKVYSQKKADFAEAKEQATKKKDNKKDAKEKKNLIQASGDLEKDYGEEVKQLEAFISSHLGMNASGEAALVLSEVYTEYKMSEKGGEALAKALSKWGDKNVLYYVMQMRSGDLWASSNQCDKASSYWKVVADSDSFISQQAQLKLGVCLQEIGKLDEAKVWFEKIKAKSPNSTEGFNAKRYLRFLEFKSKNSDATNSESKAQQNSQAQDKKS